jgi:hypothetical protein
MSDAGTGHSERQIYWNQLVLVKVVASYVRHYRDEQARWITRVGLFKAIVTSSTIGAWGVWKDYAYAWAILLGLAQVLDAAKDFIPQTKNRRNASEFVSALDTIIIDARFEWHSIFYRQIHGQRDHGEVAGVGQTPQRDRDEILSGRPAAQ